MALIGFIWLIGRTVLKGFKGFRYSLALIVFLRVHRVYRLTGFMGLIRFIGFGGFKASVGVAWPCQHARKKWLRRRPSNTKP